MPGCAEAGECGLGEALGQPESGKQQQGTEGETQVDVMENVVTHLMAKDEEGLRQSEVAGGGVPYDDALGGAEAGYIGVVGCHLIAGVHQEDARFGNMRPAEWARFWSCAVSSGLVLARVRSG